MNLDDENHNAVISPEGSEGQAPLPAAFDLESFVPEEYKSKPYMQELLKDENASSRLFREFDGLQSKLGQKQNLVPSAEASPEAWTEFYSKLRPEAPDKYELPEIQWPEEDKELAALVNSWEGEVEYSAKLKQLFFENGLTSTQAANLIKGHQGLQVEQLRAEVAKAKEGQFKNFTTATEALNSVYADKTAYVQETAKGLIEKVLPKELQPLLVNVDPRSEAVVAAIAHALHEKYVKPDNGTVNARSANGATTIPELELELSRASEEFYSLQGGSTLPPPGAMETAKAARDRAAETLREARNALLTNTRKVI
jgi:hypothetical protein